MIGDFSEVLGLVVALFDNLNIRYCVGGSVASGIRSQFRATLDIDILAEFLDSATLTKFCNEAAEKFYVYPEAALDAYSTKKSFNIIHQKLFLKVDIFTSINDFSKSELSRATLVSIPNTELKVKIATVEDMIISKLSWYKLGNCQSERQWNDLIYLVSYNKKNLDLEYLKHWAEYKKVEDQLNILMQS